MKTFFLATSISILCSISFFDFPTISRSEENKEDSFAVVQLFTSQGCSSCPSADILLDQVKNDYENVMVLSYHVDYWDRLGWKDPFSKKEFTLLQNAYGFVFNSNRIYTPQAIINGKVQFVGSNKAKMNGNLEKALKLDAKNFIHLSDLNVEKNKVLFNYNIEGSTTDKELKIALVLDNRETSIKRGENGGKKLSNSNIVLEELTISLDQKSGESFINIPTLVALDENLQLISYIQKKDYEITGASKSKIFTLH